MTSQPTVSRLHPLSRACLPLPPFEMRQLVGPTDPAFFDNLAGAAVAPDIPPELYESVFDFGCGCGRLARQLMQQDPMPRRYLGIDLHRGMVEWCQRELTAVCPSFQFRHHDVFNPGFNPGGGKPMQARFPAADHSFKLMFAWSVFTHILEDQAGFYLGEARRILDPGGLLASTWFLFDRRYFPMLQHSQNALYINPADPTNAVIFDRAWLEAALAAHGLGIVHATPPAVRGYHWLLHIAPLASGRRTIPLPPDEAPFGHSAPPIIPTNPALIGLTDRAAAPSRAS